MTKHLHIISLDIPYPADYGGAIDIFYKLKSLSEIGVEITLHCFVYGNRHPSTALEKLCKVVHYYPRKLGWKGLHFTLPYIVSSRNHKQLLQNLLNDEDPILFEGLHTTFFANDAALVNRNKILRAHNIESDYYAALAKHTKQLFKKVYYKIESFRLRNYEENLAQFDTILSISNQDYTANTLQYPSSRHILVPAFHQYRKVVSKLGKGTYCLYHGNLSVEENIKSCEFLIDDVFSQISIPLIIAGKNPSNDLLKKANHHIQIIANPSDQQLSSLIQDAHINVLPNFQQTGLKLKWLHALFAGRFCISNETNDMGLDSYKWIQLIQEIMSLEFDEEELKNRKMALLPFDNFTNAEKIIELL